MIKIRYADLPQGLHAQLRTCGRRRVIYLFPGLSPAQRRDALRRLTRTSRQGYGPPLRATEVTLAVAGDVAKSTARNALAAIRCHPVGSAALAAFLTSAVVCYSLFVTVTVRFGPRPVAPPAAAGAAPSWPPSPGGPGRSPGGGASGPAGTQPASTTPRGASPAASATGAGSVPSGSRPPGSLPPAAVPSGRGRPGPLPTGTWSGPGGVLPSTPAGPSPGTSSTPSPAPSPEPSPASLGSQPPPRGNPGGLCLQLGSLGVCISG